MRRKVRTALFSAFEERVKPLGFINRTSSTALGMRLSCEEGGFSSFLTIYTDDSEESFSVNVAWSTTGSYPVGSISMDADEPPPPTGVIINLRFLAHPRVVYAGPWYLIEPPGLDIDFDQLMAPPPSIEEVISRIPAALDDVMARIQNDAIPYLEQMKERFAAG